MSVARAERVSAVPSQASAASEWEGLDRRQVAELCLPGALIGLLGGTIAGGLAAAGGLSPALAVFSIITLGLPLAAVGAFYDVLLAKGRVPLGPMTPMALVWMVGFPVCRIFHAVALALFDSSDVVVPNGWLDFVVYNILLSIPFAIGFWWLHENFAPRWWLHIEDRNAVAHRFLAALMSSVERRQAAAPDGRVKGLAGMQERRLRRREERRQRRGQH
jgi:hypothetical protein